MDKRTLIPSAGFRTRVIDEGAGPPVLMLHGSPDSAGEWRPLIATLQSDHRCVAPDLPGLGESEALPLGFDYSLDAFGRFVDDVLAQHQVTGKLTLVVHDIGGAFGLPWAARHTDRLAAVIVTDTVAFAGFDWFPIARAWGGTSLLGRVRSAASMWAIGRSDGALFRKILRKTCPDLTREDLDRMTRELALNPAAKSASVTLFRRMLGDGFFDGHQRDLERLAAAVPVRVVWGERDPFIPPRYADAFGAQHVERLSDAGHWLPITHAANVAAAVRR